MTPRALSTRLVAGDELAEGDDQRRVADEPRLPVDHPGELRERGEAVLRARFRDVALEALDRLRARRGNPVLRGVVDVDPRVPDIQRPHSCECVDRLPVRAGDREIDLLPGLRVESTAASRDREARDEALEVPLERAWERLVEVVHVEHEPPVGGGIAAEVRQVRVAAELHVQPRPRHPRQIRGHDVRRAAVERER